jgi:hypothetical protein
MSETQYPTWESIEQQFLENVVRVRKAQGRSSIWMAQMCGWSKANQSKFDRGLRRIWLGDALLMAAALDVDVWVLCEALTEERVLSLVVPDDWRGR